MIRLVFTLFIIILFAGNSISQKLEYNIVKGGKTIGSVLAIKKTIGDTTFITITSEAKFKLLFTFNLSYFLEEKFVDGVLISGHAINYLNGKIQKKSSVQKKKDRYIVILDDETFEFPLNKITYSITSIYFEQPPKLDITIFSQQFADFLPMYQKPNDEHLLKSKNGNNNYYYNNGILEKVKVARSYATFYFELKK